MSKADTSNTPILARRAVLAADECCQIISFADRQKAGRSISIRGGNPLLEGSAETYTIELEPPAHRARPPG